MNATTSIGRNEDGDRDRAHQADHLRQHQERRVAGLARPRRRVVHLTTSLRSTKKLTQVSDDADGEAERDVARLGQRGDGDHDRADRRSSAARCGWMLGLATGRPLASAPLGARDRAQHAAEPGDEAEDEEQPASATARCRACRRASCRTAAPMTTARPSSRPTELADRPSYIRLDARAAGSMAGVSAGRVPVVGHPLHAFDARDRAPNPATFRRYDWARTASARPLIAPRFSQASIDPRSRRASERVARARRRSRSMSSSVWARRRTSPRTATAAGTRRDPACCGRTRRTARCRRSSRSRSR